MAVRSSTAVSLLVAGAYFMEMLDGTVIAAALPQMGETFGVAPVDVNIGMTAYLLTLAVLIPVSGWISERFGPRLVFTGAILVFTLASALCGLCEGLWPFVAARILQGAGGALMVPVGRLVVLRDAPKQEIVRRVAIITWPALVAPILGPPVGGFITTYASWPWIFFLNVPLGLVGAALAWRLVAAVPEQARRPFDRKGFALAGTACFCVMYGIELAGQGQVHWGAVGALAVAGAVAVWACVGHFRRAPHPLFSFEALAIRTFAVTIWGGSAFRIAISAIPFLMPLLFQLGFGLSAYDAGLLVLAIFAGNLAMKPATTRIMRLAGFRTTIIASGAVNVATMLSYAWFRPDTPVVLILALLFLGGMSRSMQFTCLNTLAFADIPQKGMTAANTFFTVVQQISIGLGIAIGAVALRAGAALAPGDVLAQFHIAFLAMAAIAALGTVDAFMLSADDGAAVSGHRSRRSG